MSKIINSGKKKKLDQIYKNYLGINKKMNDKAILNGEWKIINQILL